VVVKKTLYYSNVFSTTTYAEIPYLGVFKPGAKHPVAPAPIKALPCLWFFPLIAGKTKPPALRVVGDSEYYYGNGISVAVGTGCTASDLETTHRTQGIFFIYPVCCKIMGFIYG
jgi:hypothetical protein